MKKTTVPTALVGIGGEFKPKELPGVSAPESRPGILPGVPFSDFSPGRISPDPANSAAG
jgi:hypothetical protein